MSLRTRILSLFALCALAFVTGCERSETISFTSEDSEPQFEHGRQLIRQGRNPEALSSFLKVIAKRGDEAPESHLEAALIYQQHIKDHLAAIYHFRKYLELQPNSRQSELVKQRIEASKREFARTLPAHPMEDASVKLGYMDQLDRLQRENDQLKAEIIALRAGLPTGPANTNTISRGGFDIPTAPASSSAFQPIHGASSSTSPAEPSGEDDSPFLKAPLVDNDNGMSQPALETPAVNAPAQAKPVPPTRPGNAQALVPTPSRPTQPQATPASSGRRHVVQAKDTLSSISMRYYGNRTRVKDIIQANRDVLKGEGETLRLGMELRIP